MRNKIIIVAGILLIFFIGGLAAFYYLTDKETVKKKISDYLKPLPQYAQGEKFRSH